MQEFTPVVDDIEKTESLHLELDKKQQELSKAKSHLLSAVDECERLREQIATLSDPKFDEMAAERERLEEDVKARREKKEEIDKFKEVLEKELNALESECKELKASVESKKKEIVSLEEQKGLAAKEMDTYEKGIEELKKKLEEYKTWTTQCPAMRDTINAQISELEARYSVLVNVWNSTKSDEVLMKTLYKIPGSANNLVVGSYPDLNVAGGKLSNFTELNSWFEGIHARIDGLLNLHEQMIKCLATQTEQITATAEK